MNTHTAGLRFSTFALAVLVVGASQNVCPKEPNSKKNAPVVHTTVCAIVNHPERFDGRIVMVRGNAVEGFETFTLNDWSDASCSGNIELHDPESLQNDREFTKFMKLVGGVRPSDPIYHPCNRAPCFRYTVAATITGKVQQGLGNTSVRDVVLVIRSVSNIVATEIAAEPSQAASLQMAPLPVFPVPESQKPIPPKDPCVPEVLAGWINAKPL